MDYSMVHGCVPLARHHVQRELTAWQWAGDQNNAAVIVSELVTNAINHARVAGHTLCVRLALLEDSSILIEVADPVGAFRNFDEYITGDSDKECGRGLLIIRALGGNLSWSPRTTRGKTVRVRLGP
ncbi:ATP-binding protein [Streptomyces fractus]|uniref:ATP-binding protein n=1 Tax=Streptomyces fractus TaxID=641806 RepID=UPI003CEED83D